MDMQTMQQMQQMPNVNNLYWQGQQPQVVRPTQTIPFQPVYQTPQQPMNPITPPKVVAMVQGDLEASIFRVDPNQEVFLVDPNDPNNVMLYTRHRDANGTLSPLRKCKMVPIEDEPKPEPINMDQYAKVDDILDLINETVEKAVERKLSEISFKPASEGGKSK